MAYNILKAEKLKEQKENCLCIMQHGRHFYHIDSAFGLDTAQPALAYQQSLTVLQVGKKAALNLSFPLLLFTMCNQDIVVYRHG